MGWYYTYGIRTARDMKDSILRDIGNGRTVLASGGSGREFYVAYLCANGERAIELFLIEQSDGEYGYKPISEDMGPYYYNCPEKVIKAAGECSPERKTASDWRIKCREYAAKKRRKFNPGDRVTQNGRFYTVTGEYSRTYVAVTRDDGALFKAKISDLEPVTC
jgi:hypothetical protein